jgi:hypothetical protein
MIEIGFFYLLLMILILILLLIILLYSNGHARTIAPALLDGYYSFDTSTNNIDSTFRPLNLLDGTQVVTGISGGLNFNSSNSIPFNFKPLSIDRKRNLKGNLMIYGQSNGTSLYFSLRLKDLSNNKIIAEETDFILFTDEDFGLQTMILKFDAPYSDVNHNFSLEAKAIEPTPSFAGTSILVNAAYFNYL